MQKLKLEKWETGKIWNKDKVKQQPSKLTKQTLQLIVQMSD